MVILPWIDRCEFMILLAHYQWARLKVKVYGEELPKSVNITAGRWRYTINLWWEVLTQRERDGVKDLG